MNVRNHKFKFFDGKPSLVIDYQPQLQEFVLLLDALFLEEHNDSHFGP